MICFRCFAALRLLCTILALAFGSSLTIGAVIGAQAQAATLAEKDPKNNKKTKKPAPSVKGKSTAKGKAAGKSKPTKPAKASPAKTTAPQADKAKLGDPFKPQHIQTFGSWGVFSTTGKAKTCYILAQPKERLPASVKRDAGYVFISTRPAENVRSELSFTVGYEVKTDAKPEPKVEVGPESFALVASGSNLWLKNAADNGAVLDKLRRGSKMVVKATSQRGNQTSDSYPLIGLAQALDRLAKECP